MSIEVRRASPGGARVPDRRAERERRFAYLPVARHERRRAREERARWDDPRSVRRPLIGSAEDDDMDEIFITLPDGTRARARLQPGGWIEVPASEEDVPVGEEIYFEGRPHEIERVRDARSRVRKRLRVDPPIDLEDENRMDEHGRIQ